MTGRTFYKTVIQVEVLSEDPGVENLELEEVAHQIVHGDCSGSIKVVSSDEIDGAAAAKALSAQGSDPEFFSLDEDGHDSHEDWNIPE